ncbi:hypothetical protein [Micromonospora aurantiaca (nom. illeg.)]
MDMSENQGVLDSSRLLRTDPIIAAAYRRSTVKAGDVVVTIGPSYGKLMIVPPELSGANLTQGTARVAAGPSVEPRFLYWALQAQPARQHWESAVGGATFRALNLEPLSMTPMPQVSTEEQRRIVNFLDAEISRLLRVDEARSKMADLFSVREKAIIDGAIAGDEEVLRELGVALPGVEAPSVRLSRICKVIPGYAFASDRFSRDSDGVRLLRGINVGTGSIDWKECVFWPQNESRELNRFALRAGDVVMAMDRPWISTGMRAAVLCPDDVPALLLQRVACLRPAPTLDHYYLFWAIISSHFRVALEGDVTGVSVPHVSGEQIGSFRLRLPSLEIQSGISSAVAKQVSVISEVRNHARIQSELLAERRRALITAAVTGRIDVTTARVVDV